MVPQWLHQNIAKITLPTPFAVGDVNIYLIKGDALTLIDVGPKTDEALKSLSEQLTHLGYQIEDIEQVVLTHHHPDHAGLLDWLPGHIKVWAHPNAEKWLYRTERFYEQHDAFFEEMFQQAGVPKEFLPFLKKLRASLKFMCQRHLDGELNDADPFAGWKVIETLGHAQSHISLFRESDGVLIAGDHLLKHISPNPLLEPPFELIERAKPQLQLNHSLHKLKELSPSYALTGHGEDIVDVKEVIDLRLKKQHERALFVLKLIGDQQETIFTLCQKLFPKVYKTELGLTLSETVAQLDYLDSLGLVTVSNENGTLKYSCR
ncbi:glyoxylase-like metal-dependent hydrolase (beta-lactamase superfamily II) [Bacillus pakistanensis]|uniref:Glyoxylase-like metal-dependent hydrolase (Beta-lactamase superfamily II) n=1 Tax=Rossellomorea pakistanensis TaxID=992288 RepID=A0ABS2N9N4_9BACI|nr:MBL fold metallo-hydrolase [Bacillus pakistanensis]MBM7584529.1 glyoxylase-like metal-dependent hydrolase (beta-lactamase superfamily II) [Bacillus pakistanensis]